MSKLTIKDLRKLKPCYDPTKYLPEKWSGTLLDILEVEKCPAQDRIWMVVRLIPRELAEIFAIDCAFAARAYADAAANAYAAYAANAAANVAANAAAYAAYAAVYAAADAAAYADSAAYAAANAAAYAADATYAAANAARTLERENQIDALILLLKGD